MKQGRLVAEAIGMKLYPHLYFSRGFPTKRFHLTRCGIIPDCIRWNSEIPWLVPLDLPRLLDKEAQLLLIGFAPEIVCLDYSNRLLDPCGYQVPRVHLWQAFRVFPWIDQRHFRKLWCFRMIATECQGCSNYWQVLVYKKVLQENQKPMNLGFLAPWCRLFLQAEYPYPGTTCLSDSKQRQDQPDNQDCLGFG